MIQYYGVRYSNQYLQKNGAWSPTPYLFGSVQQAVMAEREISEDDGIAKRGGGAIVMFRIFDDILVNNSA